MIALTMEAVGTSETSVKFRFLLYFQALWVLLDKHHSLPHSEEEQLINYEDFLHVATLGGPKCK
jgi:hypothetical protein